MSQYLVHYLTPRVAVLDAPTAEEAKAQFQGCGFSSGAIITCIELREPPPPVDPAVAA